MNCARWDLCGGRSVMGVSTAISHRWGGQVAIRVKRHSSLKLVSFRSAPTNPVGLNDD